MSGWQKPRWLHGPADSVKHSYEQALPAHGVLAEFFDITKNSKVIFADTAIMKTKYAEHMNSYPTIFLSFADAKDSKNRIVACVKEQLLKVYDQYSFTLENLSIFEKPQF